MKARRPVYVWCPDARTWTRRPTLPRRRIHWGSVASVVLAILVIACAFAAVPLLLT